MKIYTKTGDTGTTGLFAGNRVPKDDARIEAYGTVDELNAALGFARSFSLPDQMEQLLEIIQNDLFCLGAELASPDPDAAGTRWPADASVKLLEQAIDTMDEQLPSLQNFILPHGTQATGAIHMARGVCRRAERRLTTLAHQETAVIAPSLLVYLNRLGDVLFVMSRIANHSSGRNDTVWRRPAPENRSQ